MNYSFLFAGNSFHSPPIKDHWDSSITICSAESSRPLLKSSDSSTYDVSADAAALSSTTLLPVAGADNELKSASLATDGQNSSYPLIGSLEDNVLMTTLHLNKAHNVPSHPCDIRKSQCYSCGKAFFCDEKCHDGQLTTDSLLLDDNSCNICLRSDNYIHVSTDIAHSPAHTLDSRKHLKGCGRSSGISPKHDCISIKSHGSNSSSGSNSTNSSEYSIPRMHAENLYDRPRSLFPHVCSFVSDEQMMKSNGLILCSSIGNNPPVKHYHSAGAQMITLCNHYLSNFKCCEKCVEKMQLTSVDASKHIPNICQAEQTISSMMCSKHSCISCSSAGALRKVVVSQVAMPHSGQVGSIQKDFQATEYSSASSCPCCATISAQKPQRGLLTNVNNPYHASHLMPETNLPPFWSCSYANYDIPRLAVAPVEEKVLNISYS